MQVNQLRKKRKGLSEGWDVATKPPHQGSNMKGKFITTFGKIKPFMCPIITKGLQFNYYFFFYYCYSQNWPSSLCCFLLLHSFYALNTQQVKVYLKVYLLLSTWLRIRKKVSFTSFLPPVCEVFQQYTVWCCRWRDFLLRDSRMCGQRDWHILQRQADPLSNSLCSLHRPPFT